MRPLSSSFPLLALRKHYDAQVWEGNRYHSVQGPDPQYKSSYKYDVSGKSAKLTAQPYWHIAAMRDQDRQYDDTRNLTRSQKRAMRRGETVRDWQRKANMA